MAVTARQKIEVKGNRNPVALPVKLGETIYQGTVVGIVTATGLIVNLTAALITAGIDFCGIVADDSANATGPAATTAVGSISGTYREASADEGDKTVRRVYLKNTFVLPLSGATQANVGKPIYAVDNYTFSTTSTNNKLIGTITAFVDTGLVEVDLNELFIA